MNSFFRVPPSEGKNPTAGSNNLTSKQRVLNSVKQDYEAVGKTLEEIELHLQTMETKLKTINKKLILSNDPKEAKDLLDVQKKTKNYVEDIEEKFALIRTKQEELATKIHTLSLQVKEDTPPPHPSPSL